MKGEGPDKADLINFEFDTKDIIGFGISAVLGAWYLLKKVRTKFA